MQTFFTVLLIILSVLAALCALLFLVYVLFLVRPKQKKPKDLSLLRDYAHRGLHGGGVPENSLKAFALACNAGFGIELDVQLSRDGEVMVFHDYSLERMTGCEKKLSELTAAELSSLRLAGTDEHIPTLREVLSLVGGKVPLLVELKGESFDISLCPKVARMLKEYRGSCSIESFNPLLVRGVKKHLPGIFGGILYTDVIKDGRKATLQNRAISLMALNFLCKPDFIAFNEIYRSSFPVKLTTAFYHAPKFTWTVKGEAELKTAHDNGEFAIFERT